MPDTPATGRESLIPLASAEALWEWNVASDALYLSVGARRALRIAPDDVPDTMTAFLARIPPACLSTLYELREGVLSGGAGGLLEATYPFGDALVREHMLVLERDAEGRALHVLGHYAVSDTLSSYLPSLTTPPDAAAQAGPGYWRYTPADRKVQIDARCAALLGYAEAAPRMIRISEWQRRLHPEEGSPAVCRYQLVIEQPVMGDSVEDIVRVRSVNGEYVQMLLRGAVLERDADGRALSMAGTLQNAQTVREGGGRQDTGRLLFVINAAGDGLWDWDAQTDHVYYSPRYLSMLGYTAEQFPGTLDVWKEKIHPEDYDKIVPPQRNIVESSRYGDTFECTYRILCADGTWTWILSRGYVTHRDANGRATRLVGLHTNITAAQNEREKLEELVKNDVLTGLRSRAYCDLELERIEKNRIRPVCVISCDINGLKLINDYMGHAAGDNLLVSMAMLLRLPLRATDCVARMGGDEFVILLPGCPKSKGVTILRQLEQHIAEYNACEDNMPVYVAFGLAGTAAVDIPLSKLLMDADRRMLVNKAVGRRESHQSIKRWIERHKNVVVSLADDRYDG